MNITSECIIVTEPISALTTWSANVENEPFTEDCVVEFALPVYDEPPSAKPIHRLSEARRQEGLTKRTIARRLGMSIREVERQESPSADILLSDLYRWKEALGLPVTELLADPDGEASTPIQIRAQLLLIMKTIRSIEQRAHAAPLKRLVETLVTQLLELMPDLKDTAPWPTVGRRRRKRDFGQAFYRRLSSDSLDELDRPD